MHVSFFVSDYLSTRTHSEHKVVTLTTRDGVLSIHLDSASSAKQIADEFQYAAGSFTRREEGADA